MSLIGIRSSMRRQSRRASLVLVLLLVSGGVAVHHAAGTGAPQGHGALAPAAHQGHLPAGVGQPASEVPELIAVCLAVLPFVAALLLLGFARRPATVLHPLPAVRAEHPHRRFVVRRARPGPYVLCVMRC